VTAVPEVRDERAGAWSAGILENDLLQVGFDILAVARDALVLFVPSVESHSSHPQTEGKVID